MDIYDKYYNILQPISVTNLNNPILQINNDNIFFNIDICSGVEPQQPPIMLAP